MGLLVILGILEGSVACFKDGIVVGLEVSLKVVDNKEGFEVDRAKGSKACITEGFEVGSAEGSEFDNLEVSKVGNAVV